MEYIQHAIYIKSLRKKTLTGNIYLYGDLNFRHVNLSDLKSVVTKFWERVGGTLDLSSLESEEGLVLPESIGRALVLRGLKSEEEMELRRNYPNIRVFR